MTPLRFIPEATQQNQQDRDRPGKWSFLAPHKTHQSVCLCLRGWPACSFLRFWPPQSCSAYFQDPCSFPLTPASLTSPHSCLLEQLVLSSSWFFHRPMGRPPLPGTLEMTSEPCRLAAQTSAQGLGKGGFHSPGQAGPSSPQQTPPAPGKWE